MTAERNITERKVGFVDMCMSFSIAAGRRTGCETYPTLEIAGDAQEKTVRVLSNPYRGKRDQDHSRELLSASEIKPSSAMW